MRRIIRTTLGLTSTLLVLAACASDKGPAPGEPVTLHTLPEAQRLAYLREATVWAPIDTGRADLRSGPPGGRFARDTVLDCAFVMPEEKVHGYTPKFLCRTADDKVWKIKYGADNREVYGEVIGSRLLWALGFFSDRIDPVRVRCSGCPEDPWSAMKDAGDGAGLPPASVVQEFEPAIIESYYGKLMESEAEEGVAWDELLEQTSTDPKRAGEQRIHREALALFAAFLQHADSKPSQQSLGCAPGAMKRDAAGAESCSKAQIYIGDIGAILGDGWKYKRMSTTKIEYTLWKETPVWADAKTCVAVVHGRPNASLGNVRVSEAARAFLADGLAQLSREQLRGLFEAAKVELLQETIEPSPGLKRTATADDWAALFQARARQIIDHRCPA